MPELLENEKELLGTAEGKDGDQHFAAGQDGVDDGGSEASLALGGRLVHLHPVRRLHYQHVRPLPRHLKSGERESVRILNRDL